MSVSTTARDASRTMLLPASPRSPAAARATIRGMCASAALTEDVVDTACLLTSELVTNAYEYGRGSMMMAADVRGAQLRVSVTDCDNHLPSVPTPNWDGVPELRGRGLLMVSSLATRWGARPRDTCGKAVWFELEPVR
jgi:anti-sigma regulatory factor (Ser/Thr protein kinase)